MQLILAQALPCKLPKRFILDLILSFYLDGFSESLLVSSHHFPHRGTPFWMVLGRVACFSLILPHSLRCPADTYFTQVAMHYPHLQHSEGQTVAFGHYEDPLPEQQATKRPVDIQNVSHNCSGYRLLHWSPRLAPGRNKLSNEDVSNVIRVAATLSYYVARQVRRDQQSSKLLLLTPHNDTVDDLVDALGLPADNFPPSLYEFYLVMIYRQQILPNTLQEFTRTDHQGKTYIPRLENVTLSEIHTRICNNPTPQQNLAGRATLDTIVSIALDFPEGFSSYCTISNTVKAIGIGGVASVFVSSKIFDFLTLTKESQARNLVALTRSKGLRILLLPSTDRFPNSSLHFLRTLCAFRHGMFSIGASSIAKIGPSSRNQLLFTMEPLACTPQTLGKRHIKSPGMAHGIASRYRCFLR